MTQEFQRLLALDALASGFGGGLNPRLRAALLAGPDVRPALRLVVASADPAPADPAQRVSA